MRALLVRILRLSGIILVILPAGLLITQLLAVWLLPEQAYLLAIGLPFVVLFGALIQAFAILYRSKLFLRWRGILTLLLAVAIVTVIKLALSGVAFGVKSLIQGMRFTCGNLGGTPDFYDFAPCALRVAATWSAFNAFNWLLPVLVAILISELVGRAREPA